MDIHGNYTQLCMDENGVGVWSKVQDKDGKDTSGHSYLIGHEERSDLDTEIKFQFGPIKEAGLNGITSEALLAVLLDRTKTLNNRFPCTENQEAIMYMQKALDAFYARTQNRKARGVEGFNKV